MADNEETPPVEAEGDTVVRQPPEGESNIPEPPPNVNEEKTDVQEEKNVNPNALNQVWSFGLNKHVPVLNLTDSERDMIMYSCAHTGILYDFKNNLQHLLQGHSNAISATCTSEDKRWLATADKGKNNIIIIWDTYTGVPVRTIFDPHPDGGVQAIAMTPNAKYIATISAAETQTVAIWDWTSEEDTPVCTAQLHTNYGVQNYIHFNPEDVTQVVTNSDCQVIFYSWKGGVIQYFAPPLTDDDFNKPVGKFSQSIFQSGSTRALTATAYGNLVVWDENKPMVKATPGSTPNKRALKLVRLQDRAINVLTTTSSGEQRYLVCGDTKGDVKFFDQNLKLANWYQDFQLGPISSLSFAYIQEAPEETKPDSDYPPDATIKAKQFIVKNFIIGTTTAICAHVTTDGSTTEVIHREHDSAVHALAVHPEETKVVIGSYSGLLQIWDYETKRVIASRYFDRGQMIRCCAFDPKAQYLGVGFTNGSVSILDALTLDDDIEEPFRYARDTVTHIAFSHDCKFMATADAEFTTTLFRAGEDQEEESWVYVGRNRAHYKLIHDMMFGVQLDTNAPRLLTLGRDRVLVEYDLENSDKDNLRLLSSDRIEQSAVPLCMAWYPSITKESFIITGNNQYKFKLYNTTTKMCRKTLLGPTYGSPPQRAVVIPSVDETADTLRYMAYITTDKIGFVKLPLDGNPHNSMAMIGHPGGISNIVCSKDGKYLFSSGGPDGSTHMWEINVTALEVQAQLGGNDLVPFYGLLDGGREGEFFAELEDYFYYAQIRSQGVDTTDGRSITTRIPLTEVPFVMRALGFYPSEQEIQDMLNEVKFSSYVETGKYQEDIDLGGFIKLYINHRPAFGLQPEKIKWAFETLGFNSENGPTIDRGELLDMLQRKGEHMTEYELAEYLVCLLGFSAEGGTSEMNDFDPTVAGDIIDENLPQDITVDMFSDEVLGFSMYKDSDVSQANLTNGITEKAQVLTIDS
ncbi:unnamed protein product [Owenia fusiformis]|uniref:Cilia- and flagella-associated protein 251 n=1 Tax=Owenia fusiformis TaxID=6347 RepID=A0A8S4Q545_OWEFU|nr:unnamed protein product [Owenia fusiformis]